MGKNIHLLAFTAFLIGVIFADAVYGTSIVSHVEVHSSEESSSSSEEDYEYHDDYYCDSTPPHKCNKPNEYYDECPPSCPKRVCGIDDRLVKCCPQPKPGDKDCNKPACRCKHGYYRDSKGNCVLWKDCPPPPLKCTKPNEYYDECPPKCPKRVCGVDDRLVKCSPQPKPGDKNCDKPACRCKHGYYRDSKGNCVLWKDCPVCPKNEKYDPCDAPCPARTCSFDPRVAKCGPPPKLGDPSCLVGCRCIDGYLRNDKGVCIPKEECKCTCQEKKCKKPNEVYDECPATCPPRVCGIDDRLIDCKPQPRPGDKDCNKPACRCKDGYYRDNKGNCVLWKNCPKCPKNEQYDPCDSPCPERTCSFDPRVVRCAAPPKLGDPACVVGCRCIDGYLRNDKGVCIPQEQCNNPKCKKNEVLSSCANGGCRRRTCKDLDRPILCIDPLECKPGCICAEGFYRDSKGNCISEKQCRAQIKCPKHEVYDPCDAPCPGRLCSVDPRLIKCAPPPKLGDPNCVAGCRCADGYLRDENGVCIPKDECGCKGDKNATFGCGVNCGQTCTDVGLPGPFVCPAVCYPDGCDCKKGFYYDTNQKKCVLPKDCPSSGSCGANEVLVQCPEAQCNIQSCSQLGFPIACLAIACSLDSFGCVCKDGYLRNSKGVCIPKNKCPSCGGDANAQPGCGTNCGKKCTDVGKTGPFACPAICKSNSCDCKDGFYFDDKTKKCVPPNKCSVTPKCKANEVLSSCANGGCRRRTCNDLDKPILCIDPLECKPGCICADGFYLDKKGKCVSEKQCRAQIGCGGDINAVPGCGVNCGRKCSDLGKPGPFVCPKICKVGGCDCKKGYFYDEAKKKCVILKQCSTCPKNEVYDDCDAPCPARTCKFDPRLVKCAPRPKPGDPNCIVGCRCADGYLRNDKGDCIPKGECGCGGDKNAAFGCGNNCGKTCSDVGKKGPFRCPKIACKPGSCECKKGFYYDGTKKRCVPPRECTPKCGLFEVFSSCANGGCKWTKCTEVGGPVLCRDPIKCEPGCVCKDGYYRNAKNICVSEKKCIEEVGCKGDKNAKPGCGVNCGKKCSDLKRCKPAPCPEICMVGGCDCKDGFYYDEKTKKCVLPEKCSDDDDGGDGTVINCENAESQEVLLRQGNYAFNGKFLYRVVKANPETSVITSAVSVMTPLAQLALYSKGATFTEIMDILNLKTKEEIRCAFPLFLDALKATDGTELSIGAKVYVKKDYKLSKSFNDDAKQIFKAEGESIDFDKAAQAAEIINKWVSGATKGKITELVTEDMFTSLTRLVLANAIYFKGTWETEFNATETKKADFYINSEKTKVVDMMEQKGMIDYNEHSDIDAKTVSLPYKDGNITFIIILPNQYDGLLNLVEKLQDGATLDKTVSSFNREPVRLFMPKFEIETKTDLKNVLKQIGVNTIFSETNAQLDGMIEPNEPLYVSEAVQKATITVDESGSEASAANAAVIATRRGPREFRADHPFLYAIKVKKTLIFLGAYYG